MKASLEAGKIVSLPAISTIADGTAVKTPGEKVFPYLKKNLDGIITIEDDELIGAFLDMMENHKMIVENSGLLSVAALKHLNVKNKKGVSILSGGNMDVITIASVSYTHLDVYKRQGKGGGKRTWNRMRQDKTGCRTASSA